MSHLHTGKRDFPLRKTGCRSHCTWCKSVFTSVVSELPSITVVVSYACRLTLSGGHLVITPESGTVSLGQVSPALPSRCTPLRTCGAGACLHASPPMILSLWWCLVCASCCACAQHSSGSHSRAVKKGGRSMLVSVTATSHALDINVRTPAWNQSGGEGGLIIVLRGGGVGAVPTWFTGRSIGARECPVSRMSSSLLMFFFA